MQTSRPISQPLPYAEALSAQNLTHEPIYLAFNPASRNEGPGRNPPVHDISAGDRFVAFVDIGIRKAFSKINKRRGN
ncbi:hypothetical protein AGABI1DRAFT_131524 [Agaricus bisporus var. burnettii JB137-S8]|uniref:Uncharacterized protein n=2 Tax=Agaricus bisporus var. burnettii TaxID=192524 RepID=K5VP20_AGABU|nr:uncharacterized protein AGABI1DRAFT_131524 [Agaricus bisporus var. burnettii JB137-S8]EKM76204.1 hypothetical protein AGABI1DRAFT_131524 [Agaricus bisporus var. burnettii JB137-S8]KAF7759798.1 hypothetical protein Agabi119p4_11493 [Agaricus bisporus var. burnettii]